MSKNILMSREQPPREVAEDGEPTLSPSSFHGGTPPFDGRCRFTTSDGTDVVLVRSGGILKARILDVVRDVRDEVPVVCRHPGEVEWVLASILGGPASLHASRMHVVQRDGRRYLYLGSLGLCGGGNQTSNAREKKPDAPTDIVGMTRIPAGTLQPSTSETPPVFSPTSPRELCSTDGLLKGVIENFSLQSTYDLVQGVNCWPDQNERTALIRQLLSAYVDALGKPMMLPAEHIITFASLNNLRAELDVDKNIMKDQWFRQLCSTSLERDALLDGLLVGLQGIDVGIFSGAPTVLIELAKKLLSMFDPSATMHFPEQSAPRQCKILGVVYVVFHLIHVIHPIEWDMSRKDGIFAEFKSKAEEIVDAARGCFPLLHSAKLVQQSIIKLGSHDTTSKVRYNAVHAYRMLKIGATIWNTVRIAIGLKFQFGSLEEAYDSFKEVRRSFRGREKWFDRLEELNLEAGKVIDGSSRLDIYLGALEEARKEGQKMSLRHCKHLRYGIVEQLTFLLSLHLHPVVDDALNKQLCHFTDFKDAIGRDPDIQRVVSDDAEQPRVGDNGPGSSRRKTSTNFRHPPGDTTMRQCDSLFSKVKEGLAATPTRWYGEISVMSTLPMIGNSLRDQYKSFKYAVSPDNVRRDILSLQFKTVLTDDQRKPTDGRDRDPKDLLSNEENTLKVLLLGMRGAGKSTFGRSLAYEWSIGEWGTPAAPVFFLSMSDLIKTSDNDVPISEKPLAQCIVQGCLSAQEQSQNIDALTKYVERALKHPKTLVILDDIEQSQKSRKDIAAFIKNRAMKGGHQLLILARHHSVHDIRSGDDVAEFELAGLDDGIVEQLLSERCGASLESLKACPRTLELCRNPLHLGLLCNILRHSDNSLQCPSSSTSHLCHIVEAVWRLWDSETGDRAQQSSDAFDELGKLALKGVASEECNAPVRVDHAGDDQALRENCLERGLLKQCNNEYAEFSNPLFMQYFAGRSIAIKLFQGGQEEIDAEALIQKVKYSIDHCETMRVIACEVSKLHGAEGIQKLLRVVDRKPREIIGVQHLRSKMVCLQQWCTSATAPQVTYDAIDKEFNISKTLKSVLKRGIKNVRNASYGDDSLLRAFIHLLKENPCVAKKAMKMMQTVMSEVVSRKWNVDKAVIEAFATIIQLEQFPGQEWKDRIRDELGHKGGHRRAVIGAIGIMGKTSARIIPSLLELLRHVPMDAKDDTFRKAILDMLTHGPEHSHLCMDDVMEICEKGNYWSQMMVARVIKHLAARSQNELNWLVPRLLMLAADPGINPDRIIETLAVCVKHDGRFVDDILAVLPKNREGLSSDRRNAIAKVLVEIIRQRPEKAEEITVGLLEDSDHRDGYSMMTPVLEFLSEIGEYADVIVRLVKEKFGRNRSQHSMGLILKTIIHSPKHLQGLMWVLEDAFRAGDWTTRKSAIDAVKAVAQHQPTQLTIELVKQVAEECRPTMVWKERINALETAEKILATGSFSEDLVPACLDALQDEDDELRKQAAKAIKTAVKQNVTARSHLCDLCQSAYTNAPDSSKHGIIYCINLISKECPEVCEPLRPVLMTAIESEDSQLRMIAVDAWTSLTKNQKEMVELVNRFVDASGREDDCFSALESLIACCKADRQHVPRLVDALTSIPRPRSEEEWLIHHRALSLVLKHPHIQCVVDLLDTLADKESNKMPRVLKERRRVIEDLSLPELVTWCNLKPVKPLLQQIYRRLYWAPCVPVEVEDGIHYKKLMVYSKRRVEIEVNNRLMKVLYSVSIERRTSLKEANSISRFFCLGHP